MDQSTPYKPVGFPYGDGYKFLAAHLITRIESADKYCRVYCLGVTRPYMVSLTMDEMLKRLPEEIFSKVHRCYIVSIIHVRSLNNTCTRINYDEDHPIPVSDTHRTEFLTKMRLKT